MLPSCHGIQPCKLMHIQDVTTVAGALLPDQSKLSLMDLQLLQLTLGDNAVSLSP